MRRFRRSSQGTDRRIDEWEFRSEWVRDGKEGDRIHAVYTVRLRRSSKPYDPELSEYNRVKFYASLDVAQSSPGLKANGNHLEASTYEELYNLAKADFETFLARDWRKIILVGIETPTNHKVDDEGTGAALSFNYAVVERAGKMYRRTEDYLTRDTSDIVDGEEIVELPYSEETERALAGIKGGIELLTDRLKKIIKSPEALARLKLPTLLQIK